VYASIPSFQISPWSVFTVDRISDKKQHITISTKFSNLGSPVPTNPSQIWYETVDPRSMLTCQISFTWICLLCRPAMAKNAIFGKFSNLGRAPVSTCLRAKVDEGQSWYAKVDSWSTLTSQISSQSVYAVTLGWKKTPNCTAFWTLTFCGVAIWQCTEKVSLFSAVLRGSCYFHCIVVYVYCVIQPYGCRNCNKPKQKKPFTTTNFPYPTVSKLFLYSDPLREKSCLQTLSFKSVSDKCRHKQKLYISCPSPTNSA